MSDLTWAQEEVLRVLAGLGQATLGDVARRVGRNPGAVRMMLERLERLGYTVAHPEGWQLTERGKLRMDDARRERGGVKRSVAGAGSDPA